MNGNGISKMFAPETFVLRGRSTNNSGEMGSAGWLDNRRVVYWCWLYIKKATYEYLKLNVVDENPQSTFYQDNNFPGYPDTQEKRVMVLLKWINGISEKFGVENASRISREIEKEWLFIYERINPPRKFIETKNDSLWAYNYLRKKSMICSSGLKDVEPKTHIERRLFVTGFYDTQLISEPQLDIILKDKFFDKMEMAFYKMKSRKRHSRSQKEINGEIDSGCVKKNINVNVSELTKDRLAFLSEKMGKKYTFIIEDLINEKYKEMTRDDDPFKEYVEQLNMPS